MAKGFFKIYGQKYTDTFSPSISMTVFCFLFAIAAQHGLKMRQFDVKTPFLISTSEDKIFIEQPRGF